MARADSSLAAAPCPVKGGGKVVYHEGVYIGLRDFHELPALSECLAQVGLHYSRALGTLDLQVFRTKL